MSSPSSSLLLCPYCGSSQDLSGAGRRCCPTAALGSRCPGQGADTSNQNHNEPPSPEEHSSQRRRQLLLNFLMLPLSCRDGLVIPDWGLGTHTRVFFSPSTKFKTQALSPPFRSFEGGFSKLEAKRQVCFCSRFVTLLVETVTSKCKKEKTTPQELETDYAFGISLPIHQQLTRSCFNFCCFNTCSAPQTLPNSSST